MFTNSFAPEGRDMRPAVLKKYFPKVGCDLPEQGGISGNIKVNKKPSPFVLEERPAVYNPETGEMVYRDTIKPKYACWFA